MHCNLRNSLFYLESKIHNFSLVCAVKHIFSLVKNNYTDYQNDREETCFNNAGTKWIIQIRMTGHALTLSKQEFLQHSHSASHFTRETHDLLKPPHLISQNL